VQPRLSKLSGSEGEGSGGEGPPLGYDERRETCRLLVLFGGSLFLDVADVADVPGCSTGGAYRA